MNDQVNATRVVYFDTTKGILMLLLVWGHLIIFARNLNITTDFNPVIQNSVPFFRAFFMQTLFIITGFCTSWNTPFRIFLLKNVKTLFFPAFAFIPFTFLTKCILNEGGNLEMFLGIITSFLTKGIPWFLAALFIAKNLYWLIQKVCKNAQVEWLIVLFSFIVGLVIRDSTDLPNNWSYQHALLMIPFLTFGKWIKIWNRDGFSIGKYVMGGGNFIEK